MEGLDYLKKTLLSFADSRDRDLQELEQLFTLKTYKKNDFFLKEKNISKNIGFVVSGILREFYTDKDGREYNKTFCLPGYFTGSYYDLSSAKPSVVSIQAMTDVKILVMSYSEYKRLVSNDIFWLKIAYSFAHNLLISKIEKEYQLLTLSATERYDLLLSSNKDFKQLIPDYHIASYLGITPISLSRIRSNKIKIRN
ncbi:MAG: Crp/Fnr family transcriptional regulator [Bacteroidota bacterium]|nr:Crp/Fnr family transcriptional regulator [Bacteroidota bacterium]